MRAASIMIGASILAALLLIMAFALFGMRVTVSFGALNNDISNGKGSIVEIPLEIEPTLTPEPQTIEYSAAVFQPQPLGPVSLTALYCWKELDPTTLYYKLSVLNPSDKPIAVWINDEGLMRLQAGKANDSNRLVDRTSTCRIRLALRRADEGNSYLLRDIQIDFSGVMLQSPFPISESLVHLYFDALARKDMEVLETYAHPTVSTRDLARLIAYRANIDPVKTTIEDCSFLFSVVPPNTTTIVPISWRCNARVISAQYGSAPGSTTWLGVVHADLSTRKVTIEPRL